MNKFLIAFAALICAAQASSIPYGGYNAPALTLQVLPSAHSYGVPSYGAIPLYSNPIYASPVNYGPTYTAPASAKSAAAAAASSWVGGSPARYGAHPY